MILKKEKRIHRVVHISSLLTEMIKSVKLEKKFTIEMLRKEWPLIAGSLSSMSSPEKIEKNIIYIKTQNSIISNEIIMLKHTIIEKCNSIFGNYVYDIRTFIGGKL